jgi:amino acid transporter
LEDLAESPVNQGKPRDCVHCDHDPHLVSRIVIIERIQAILVSFQFILLIVMSIIALVRVYGGSGLRRFRRPSSGVVVLPVRVERIGARGVILCIFIYWGWDSCLVVTDETKTPTRHRVGRP